MVPALSLNYSSQSGDGVTGLGFALSGLSSITRCPRTIAQDATHGSVNYDNNDRFCLDGQRLMVLGGGTYGANNTEYRTEIDSFSKIIAHGTAGNGPAWFEVHTKSGQTLEFGNTADSQVLATGKTTARMWSVNKISDTAGNYLIVTYNSSSGSDRTARGEVYPLRIDYTGNATAGVAPYNSVRFSYNCVDGVGTCRADSIPQYQTGSITQLTALMTNIKTYQGSNLVADYQLSYRAGTVLVHSRLTSVTQCDGSSNCLPATTFGWQGGTAAQTKVEVSTSPNPSFGVINIPGDFNGDGLTDLAKIATFATCPPYPIFLGGSSPGFSSSSYVIPNPASGWAYCSAYDPAETVLAPNGTAASSILITATDGAGHFQNSFSVLAASNGIVNTGAAIITPAHYADQSPPAGDYNGDGIPDVLIQSWPTNSFFYTGTTGGTFTSNSYAGLDPNYTRVHTGDFDGDGCTDLYAYSIATGGTNSIIYGPYCNPAASTGSLPSTTGYDPHFGDFNGDGKTDVLLTDPTGANNAQLWLSTGTGFIEVNSSISGSAAWGTDPIETGDWNGDGRADIADPNTDKVYLSTGTDFAVAKDSSGTDIVLAVDGIGADFNNDGVVDGLGPSYIDSLAYSPEMVTSISNGIGATTNVTYDRINKNGSFYQKCSTVGVYDCGDTYPIQSVDGPLYVVSRVDASNGLGTCNPSVSFTNCYSTTYAYAFGKTNLTGRGFLGFGKVTITDLQTNIVQTTNYSQTFPYIGLATSQTKVDGAVTLNSVTSTLAQNGSCGATPAGTGVVVACLTETIAAGNDLNGAVLPTVTTDYTYDNYQNPLTVNRAVSDGSYKNATNTYNNDTTRWYLGRMLTTSVTSHVGTSTMTRASSFAYDTNTGLMTQEVIEPGVSTCNSGSSSCTLTTAYIYDSFGNRVTSTVSGTGIPDRSSSALYDGLGQFQIQATNALGQSENWTYDARFGTPTTHTGPNLLATSWIYDGFGRLTQESHPDGTIVKSSYAYCGGGCPTNGAFFAQSESFASDGTTQIGPIGTGHFDSLARPIATDAQGFNGNTIRVATIYEAKERVYQTSRPYYIASDIPRYTTYSYDDLGRVIQALMPDASVTNFCFNGLKTAVSNNLNQTTTTLKNAQGLNASVVQGTGIVASVCNPSSTTTTTSYVYNAFDNLLTVADPSGNVITNSYDIRGNKISSADPDMGTWTYAYDVLAELVSQTDAKSQITTLTYDLLGRLLSRTESGLFSSWTYGISPGAHNIGKVVDAQTCTTSGCTSVVSDRTFTFDSVGRPDATILHVGSNDYGYHYSYNSTNGQLSNLQYPSGYSVNYSYNSYGYLAALAETNGASIWTANARDAEMHLTSQTQGNGILTTQAFDPNTGWIQNQRAGGGATISFNYSFDTIGNLTARADNIQAYTERFCYDSLNRVINFNIAAACTGGKTAAYDSTGNITSRSEVGTYSYPTAGSARPHAVSSITGSVDGLTNPKYTYDANGNMTCTSTGTNCTGTIGRQFTVTSFNMAATLTQGTTSLTLTYDDQHARVTQAATVSGTTTTTTYLNDPVSGAMSQKVQVGSAVPQWVDYIQTNSQIVAQRAITYPSGSLWGFNNWAAFNWGPPAGSVWGSFNWGSGTWTGPLVTWSYFSLDHLGSVVAITDQAGATVQSLFYDPWGKRRNANGTDAVCGTITSTVTRGFTNQEQMPMGCFVNLNARIYDAKIGRFMTPDSIVPEPMNGQALNRFSYVNNNPISLADRSGNFPTTSDGGLTGGGLSPGYCIGNCFGNGFAMDMNPRMVEGELQQWQSQFWGAYDKASRYLAGSGPGSLSAMDPNQSSVSGSALTNPITFIVSDTFGQEGWNISKYAGQITVTYFPPAIREAFSFSVSGPVPNAYGFAQGVDSNGRREGGSAQGQGGVPVGHPGCPSDIACLTYITLGGSAEKQPWYIRWQLTKPAPANGYIVQYITITGKESASFTELWSVTAGATVPDALPYPVMPAPGSIGTLYDDVWQNHGAGHVTGEARFYPGLTLPPDVFGPGKAPQSGDLLSAPGHVMFNNPNGTPPIIRNQDFH